MQNVKYVVVRGHPKSSAT